MSGRIETWREFPIHIPNSVIEGDGFYVSYNDVDTHWYGCDTTALVLGEMEHFYILNGDHTKQYQRLIPQGLESCLEYFKNNKDIMNKYSEEIVEKEGEE